MAGERPLHPIAMRNVSRRFDGFLAVHNLSLEVPSGTILGVIGPSGSGKTTAIRMLTGTLEPTSGDVRVLGENPRHFQRSTRERIGYVPQLFVLWEELTVSENVSFVASLFGLLWPRRRRRVREVLETVELWDARHRRAKQLSGGMQRRLALACALVHEPDLLFVDEPSAGLDPVLRDKVWRQFRWLRDQGRTMLVTTQYVGEAEHCDRVALLAGGRLIALDTPQRLRQVAMGGDVIELETRHPAAPGLLKEVPGVREVRQRGLRKLLVIAEDGSRTTPRLLEALRKQGGEVVSSREYHPPFDEVFAELLAQHGTDSEERRNERRAA